MWIYRGLRCGRRHRNWPNRTSCGLPTTDLVLSVVDFTDRAVGTDSKSRSRNYPRLPRESVSVYPHEMSLKPSWAAERHLETFKASLQPNRAYGRQRPLLQFRSFFVAILPSVSPPRRTSTPMAMINVLTGMRRHILLGGK